MSETTKTNYTPETCWIETYSGDKFFLLNPTFKLEDITHSLAMNCRFNGHTKEFYSVAEHSVLVANLMSYMMKGNPLEGLIHDFAEAYLTDVPSPMKQFLTVKDAYDLDLNEQLEVKVREHFGFGPKMSEACKTADMMALFIEAYYLMPGQGKEYTDVFGLREKAILLTKQVSGFKPLCLTPKEAKVYLENSLFRENPLLFTPNKKRESNG